MKILASNVGSTSLKFKLYDMPSETVLASAKVERIGSSAAIFTYENLRTGYRVKSENITVPDYTCGIKMFLAELTGNVGGVISDENEINAIAFKTVLSKGYYGVHYLTEEVLQGMRDYLFVAPVHNSAYLEAIGVFRSLLPDIPMVGAFETAFHTTVPDENSMYSIPYEWYEKYGIKKFGYHGASHSYVAEEALRYGNADRLISCHLGGSCSICAIKDGKSYDTSFGFSLQTGLMHANRCGDIDPYIVPFLQSEGMSLDGIMKGLEKNGGLMGISGVSGDFRLLGEAAEQGNERAKLAVKMFENSIIRHIGMFTAELGGADCIAFTGGIGENSAELRSTVCGAFEYLGLKLDPLRNGTVKEGIISADDSAVRVLVIPANEELGITRKTFEKIKESM